MNLDLHYQSNGFYDEMLAAEGRPRPAYRRLYEQLNRLGRDELQRRHALAMEMFRNHGITFGVYPDAQGTEKVFPFDVIPRVVEARTWQRLEEGLKQRLRALNLFLDDVYGRKQILKQRAIPPEIVLSSSLYMREVEGLAVPHGIHCHIAGIDLVRDEKGDFFVLEDNVRTPSGASYVLANRYVMKRVLPDLFAGYPVRPVEGYVHELLRHLRWLAPAGIDDPTVVLLTPGINNSAYYEHLYLAKQMGVELVEGSDLVVDDDHVFMRTTRGLRPVHVIYRRIDDEWLDPIFGRQESLVGVAGLVNAYRAGNVAIANALGNGVADDKAVYSLVPKLIRYYLDEDPILPTSRPTCARWIRIGGTCSSISPRWWSRRSTRRVATGCSSGPPPPKKSARSSPAASRPSLARSSPNRWSRFRSSRCSTAAAFAAATRTSGRSCSPAPTNTSLPVASPASR